MPVIFLSFFIYCSMDSQKLENLLNVALQTDKNGPGFEGDTSVGYDFAEKTWELIVKYNG
ncbi:MAG: hypothetical protein IKJ15_05525, partial [Lachnospiraceae bacterium]|nr:hypothetical protein [Lachnospiraceae bacterium]